MSHQTSKQKNKKEFGVIGLGRMGGDLTLQAIEVSKKTERPNAARAAEKQHTETAK